MEEDILDIFYNSIIPEASSGAIDCFMYYHICFNTSIEGKIIEGNIPYYIDAPLLEIRNKEKFDELLEDYVNLALNFYDDHYFYDEVLSGEYRTSKNKLCKEKVLMTLLWSNATVEDFQEPCSFLRRQKTFLENNFLTETEDKGFSTILGGRILTKVAKTRKISWESPYAFRSAIVNHDDGYDLPTIRFGIEDDNVYIYCIHQGKNIRKNNKIKRALYKVNENFNKQDSEDILKDITPSFLVALQLFILHFNNLGYSKFKIIPYLPERWIDKKIMIYKKARKAEKKAQTYNEYTEQLLRIQENLTQKFCNTLLRLKYHLGDSITIDSLPFELDSYLAFSYNNLDTANNNLLQELYSIYANSKEIKLR
ncbi:MAG: hypothetical protein OSJ70_03425 [Bacilli bacterium]|nr:hypothetical protein [Bacilli bacterium]